MKTKRLKLTDYRSGLPAEASAKAGLTLVELLLTLALGAFLSIVILNTLTSLIKTQRLLISFNRLEINTSRILTQLQADIRWAHQITVSDPHTITIQTVHDQVTYQWQPDHQLLTRTINGQSSTLNPDTVTISEFTVSSLRNSQDPPSLPLVNVILTVTPAHSPTTNQLVLEKNIAYTTKLNHYEIK